MTSYKKQNIGVFGLSKTGMSVCEDLQDKSNIIAYDDLKANREIFEELFDKIPIVSLSDVRWQNLDKIVLSPGVPLTHEVVNIAKNFKIPIISDIDLFFEKSKNLNLIAVTGTNGKSTTTALISHILNSSGLDYPIAGNIGVPVLQARTSKDGYVLELSSFQLDLVKTFTAKIAVLLNITPDHLDRHKNMDDYIAAKSKIFDRMDQDSYAVINIDNDYCRELFIKLQQEQHVKLIPLSVTKILEKGISIVNDVVDDRFFGNISFKLPFNKNLQGIHNCENIVASYAVARTIVNSAPFAYKEQGAKPITNRRATSNVVGESKSIDYIGLEAIKIIEAIGSFQGLPHRMQYVGSIGGINFYNDSKATNAIAAVQSIKALDNIYWLAGGIPKDGGIEEIKPYFNRIKKAYFYGQAKEIFASTAKDIVGFVICDDLSQAFDLAYKDACSDNSKIKNILLAPCCSSYDQFKSFEQRGELFIKLCNKINRN